jgi:RNA polymerase-interacting CarD/CdnL/TRCF family regulator
MVAYKVGESVVHWIYGIGKIVAIADKGLPGRPCLYYVIEGNEQTLWVPVNEGSKSSLHLPTLSSEFEQFISVLRSAGKKMPDNPFQRRNELDQRMQKRSLVETCLIIRDLNYRSHIDKLSSSEIQVLKHAQSFLLDEWERSLGTPREKAKREMEWILKESPVRQNSRTPQQTS